MLQERQRAKKKSRTEARNDLPDEVQLLAPEEYDVLDSSLGTFGHTSAQVLEVYHTLVMRHSECDETQLLKGSGVTHSDQKHFGSDKSRMLCL